jgi:hypothetical protein
MCICDYTFYFSLVILFGSLFSWHVGIGHGVVVSFLGLCVVYSIHFVEPMSIVLGIIIYTCNSYRHVRWICPLLNVLVE